MCKFPSQSVFRNVHWCLCAGIAHWIKTNIKDGLLWVLVAAEDKEGAKVVGLDKGKVASVI